MWISDNPAIRLVRAANPSALTGSGTNTYLVGRGDVAVIDPGPDSREHLAAILAALDPGERITHILVTHPHLDHSALAPRLSAHTRAVTAAFGTATAGRSSVMSALAAERLLDVGEGLDRAYRPDLLLADGDLAEGTTWTLRCLHTPGHLGAHLCFALGDVLFSGDHVMGWSSSIVAPPDGDMADYIASLHRLADEPWRRLLPGHGDPVDAPAERIAGLIRHRREREAQILAELRRGPSDATTLATRLYTGVPPVLLKAASANVLAHLIDLEGKHMAKTSGPIARDSIFRLA